MCLFQGGTIVKNKSPRAKASWRRLLRDVHRDERGQVSIETVLIVAAIALPILIFLYKFAWPRIQKMFNSRLTEFEGDPAAAR